MRRLRFGVAAIELGVVAVGLIAKIGSIFIEVSMPNYASRWLCNLGKTEKPINKPKTRVYASVFELENNDCVFANVEIIAEEYDGKGRYRFILPNGRILPLDLSDGDYRIVRQTIKEEL